MSGKKIEQKLLDYNQEAERFGGVVTFSGIPLFSFGLRCSFVGIQEYHRVWDDYERVKRALSRLKVL